MSSILSPNHVSNCCSKQFFDVFGAPPDVLACAPGRVNLIGEHVDYQDGLVMPAAINRYVFGAARAVDQPVVRLWSSAENAEVVVPLDQQEPLIGDQYWANYIYGVFSKYRDAGHPIGGFEAAFTANLPCGAGLSSSAALEAATAVMVESLIGIELSPLERALLCQRAEHDWAGVPCGIMDQLAVNCGVDRHALLIDCESLGIVPTALPDVLSIVVVNSRVKHALADGEYGRRCEDCESAADALGVHTLREVKISALEELECLRGERVYRRARHVVTEIERVKQFSAALCVSDTARAGQLMAMSHVSLRDDFEVSCAEIDALVQLAEQLGAIGARIMGGGFGGCTVNLVGADKASEFSRNIVNQYHDEQGMEVEAFVVTPVGGAKAGELKS